MFGKNVQLGKAIRVSPWRKVAMAGWDVPTQGSVYGMIELPASAALLEIQNLKKNGSRVTISHFLAKALAETAHQCPELNTLIRFGRLYPRQEVRIFFMVASDDTGEDLSGLVLVNPHKRTLAEIAAEMDATKSKIRKREEKSHDRMKGLMHFLPGWLAYLAIRISSFVFYSLNIWVSFLGLPKDPFGSIMVTNFGSLGIDAGFAPLVPYTRAPFLFAVGKIKDSLKLQGDKVTSEKILPLFVTFDHRYLDGVQGARIIRTLRGFFENPRTLLD